MSTALPSFTWVVDDDGVAALGRALDRAPSCALDTESNSRFVYRERVCLLQVNAGGELFLVDTLALDGGARALEPLRASFEDPDKPVYLHGGEYDVACLKRDYAIALRSVFDTQQAASFLGFPRTSYGVMVEEVCEVTLAKEHGLHDWGLRPIDPEALRYALDDVIYLPGLAETLNERIVAADLQEELAIANAAVEGVDAHRVDFEPAGMFRIKGVGRLDNAHLPLLSALYRWRDEEAQRRDLPPGRLVNNEALLQIARIGPTNFSSLRRVRLPGRVLREQGEAIIDVIKAARAQPPAVPDAPARREPDPAEREYEQRLKRWRRSEAERRDVPLQVVLPARALEYLKKHGAEDLEAVPQLGAKRIALYGEQLRELCG